MANFLYDVFRQGLLLQDTTPAPGNITADVIKATLSDAADYASPSQSADASYATDVPAAAKVAVQTLGTLSGTDGTFDSADFTWSAVSGDQSEQVIIWDDDMTSPADMLMIFYDTGMTGMPVTPNGGDINVTVNGSGWVTL